MFVASKLHAGIHVLYFLGRFEMLAQMQQVQIQVDLTPFTSLVPVEDTSKAL
jgi:hypothetical protein